MRYGRPDQKPVALEVIALVVPLRIELIFSSNVGQLIQMKGDDFGGRNVRKMSHSVYFRDKQESCSAFPDERQNGV